MSGPSIHGKIELIANFDIPQLDTKRNIWVYLPPDYEFSKVRYPVIYMHDGQNLFFDELSFVGAWKINEAVDLSYAKKKNLGIIIVGIAHGDENRLNEYSPWKHDMDPAISGINNDQGGRGDKYASFIVDTLKPFIDQKYRTKSARDFNYISGSSMGGLISLYIGLKHSDIFSKIAALSPAFWFAKSALIQFINYEKIPSDIKVYLDAGSKELPDVFTESYVSDTIEIHKLLGNKISPNNNIVIIDNEGVHNESSWKKRFPIILDWLFNLGPGIK